ncbi:MAG: TraR/DksA family transcriptional regulator [Actinomycetota bacterium]
MEQSQLDTIKSTLAEERKHVEQQLVEHGAAVDGGGVEVAVDEGFADSAQATAERSELLSLIEQLQAQHAEILAALDRIDQGTYGKCERCGQGIPFERLEALPTARLCVSCKQSGRS